MTNETVGPFERLEIEQPWGVQSVLRSGSGDPVILLHSLAMSGDMWQYAVADGWLADRTVLAVDVRGHGHSTWDGNQFTIDEAADDLVRVLDQLGHEQSDVIGLSMGGSIAMTFAAAHPGRVRRLALCDTTAYYGDDAVATWEQRATAAVSKPREHLIPFQVSRWFSDDYMRLQPTGVNRMVRVFLATNPEVHAAACRALGSLDAREAITSIAHETLIIVGSEDYATPPEMAKAAGKAIATSTVEIVDGARHFGVIESADIRSRLAEFLS